MTDTLWHSYEANGKIYIGEVGSQFAIVSTAKLDVVTDKGRKKIRDDVARIVRAVNRDHAFDEVVKALRKIAIRKHVRMGYDGTEIPNGFSCDVCHSEWDEGDPERHTTTCCAVLAKAGGAS